MENQHILNASNFKRESLDLMVIYHVLLKAFAKDYYEANPKAQEYARKIPDGKKPYAEGSIRWTTNMTLEMSSEGIGEVVIAITIHGVVDNEGNKFITEIRTTQFTGTVIDFQKHWIPCLISEYPITSKNSVYCGFAINGIDRIDMDEKHPPLVALGKALYEKLKPALKV